MINACIGIYKQVSKTYKQVVKVNSALLVHVFPAHKCILQEIGELNGKKALQPH